MPSSDRRTSRPAEAEPLLPSEHSAEGADDEGPWWAFWRQSSAKPYTNGHVRFEDPEVGRPEREHKKRRRREYVHWLLYAFLLILGMTLGGLFTTEWSGRRTKLGDGPMVPPVYTLPPPTGLPRNPAYLIEASTGAVASEDVTCSNLGVSILRDRNGTAVDAAITTTLCVGLLNAFSSGIGGGGFMLVRVPDTDGARVNASQTNGTVTAIDFRETSPAGSEKEMYGTKRAGRVAAQVGGLAIGVPGELRGLEAAHKLYGSLPWEQVIMPVAELAKGWQVSRELARRIRIFGQFMRENPTWSSVYAPRGALLVEGEYVKRLAYGRTLERIAKHGADAFYTGEIAEDMVETIEAAGGIVSLEDLREYEAVSYPAIHQSWMGKEVYTTSAPTSGGAMLGLLNILEPLNLHATGGLSNATNVHLLIEAMKFAFGARSEITDPAFASNLTRMDEFRSKEWADAIRPLITNTTHDIPHYGLQHDTPIDHGTTHLSVVDRWGGAASVTSTVNLIWGSHVMCPKTGVIFNDEQDDFSVPGAADAFGLLPSPWNYPAPGKRPLSSTAATIIHTSTGALHAVLGGSGGSRIFPSIAQVLLNLEAGLNLSAAIERPRVHNQIVPPITTIEVGPEGEDVALSEGLRARGHTVGLFDVNLGIAEVQAILLEEGRIWASSDSRKNGVAAGY